MASKLTDSENNESHLLMIAYSNNDLRSDQDH